MNKLPVDRFCERLTQSNLLSSDTMQLVRRDVERIGPRLRSDALGRRMVREGQLTQWQVDMLLAGNYAFFLGKYKLLDLLGFGGMGVVFKAQHATLGRIVAVKVLHKERMRNPAVVARFHREIQVAATLNNPHVVVAYDADCVRDTHFLVMEYVDGTDLATIIEQEGRLHVEEACEFVRQAALGLQHGHERNLIHRDIKPSNLIVAGRETGDPLVKILDMGLARFVSEQLDEQPTMRAETLSDNGLTQVGQVMGTPDYMSPEQAWNTQTVDIRSDIYSLGCTLYLFLTGRFAFQGPTAMEKVVARATSDPNPPSAYQTDIPPELDAVVLKMMAREPQDRFQTPAQVARALERFAVLPDDVLTVVAADAPPVAVPVALPCESPAGQTAPATIDMVHELTLVEEQPTAEKPKADTPAPTPHQQPPASGVDARLDEFLQALATDVSGGSPAPAGTAGNEQATAKASQTGQTKVAVKRMRKRQKTGGTRSVPRQQ